MHRRRVLDRAITYIGLDVHKDTIAVALAEAGGAGKAVQAATERGDGPRAMA
jgi:hypothetical protein